jgi:branched-chain amino acid transport system permease protein
MTPAAAFRAATVVAIFAAAVAIAVLQLGGYAIEVATSLAMWIALSESWVVLSGNTGYVSLGHVVFFGLGSYVTAVTWGVVPVGASLLLGGVAAALLALVAGYPCFRVRGPYFVMLTFGLAEFVRFAIIAIEARASRFGRVVFGGPGPNEIFLMMVALGAAAFIVSFVVRRSRFGLGLRAIREDEEAASTSGVPIVHHKLAAFCLSAIIPGIAGGLFLLRSGYFEPTQVFSPSFSLTMITMAIVGGSEDAYGPLAGAAFLVVLSELLWASAPAAYMVILGVLLVVFVLKVPDGVDGRVRSVLSGRLRPGLKKLLYP